MCVWYGLGFLGLGKCIFFNIIGGCLMNLGGLFKGIVIYNGIDVYNI